MRQIFIDMDGVVADLDGFYFNLTGLPSPKSGGPEGKSFWRVVNKYTKDTGHSFYQDLPILPDAHQLVEGVKKFCPTPTFLTGGGNPGHHETTEGKQIWVDHYFPDMPMICCKSSEKCLHGKPDDILIDDWTKHRQKWLDMGGIFILHTSAKSSLQALQTLYGGDEDALSASDEAASDPT